MLSQQGLAMAGSDSSYLIFVLGSVIIAGIAGWKWVAKKIDQLVSWGGPIVSEFASTHNEAVVALRDNLVETTRTTTAIHEKLTSVHQVLDKHGEKLANIDRRTQHLDNSHLS